MVQTLELLEPLKLEATAMAALMVVTTEITTVAVTALVQAVQ